MLTCRGDGRSFAVANWVLTVTALHRTAERQFPRLRERRASEVFGRRVQAILNIASRAVRATADVQLLVLDVVSIEMQLERDIHGFRASPYAELDVNTAIAHSQLVPRTRTNYLNLPNYAEKHVHSNTIVHVTTLRSL